MKTKIICFGTFLMLCISSIVNAQITNRRTFPPVVQNNDISKWHAHPDSSVFQFSLSPDHFLIGTLNGYLGRKYFNPKENTIDNYKDAKHLKNYIFEFIKEHYQTIPDNSKSEYLEDQKVATIINSYFDKEGKILIKELENENELYSYILGKYLKYGEHLDADIYKIQIVNSFEGDLVYKSLKQLGCDKILYKRYRGYIPNSQIYYFEATPRMIKYFKSLSDLKEKILDESILSYLVNNTNNTKDDIKRIMEEMEIKEVNKVKDAFRNEI